MPISLSTLTAALEGVDARADEWSRTSRSAPFVASCAEDCLVARSVGRRVRSADRMIRSAVAACEVVERASLPDYVRELRTSRTRTVVASFVASVCGGKQAGA